MKGDQSFEQALADKLRASEQSLDEETTAQLLSIRQLAQQAAEQKPGYRRPLPWLVAATVAAVAIFLSVTQIPSPQQPLDDPLFTAEERGVDIELLENLEFYAWLAAQEDLG